MLTRALTVCLSFVLATSASAQGLMPDMHRDVTGVQKKFIDLANAIPESAYSWHPNGARTVGEVLLHIAGENYLIPSFMGKPVPAGVSISAADMKSVDAYEARKLTKAQIIAELEASFANLHAGLGQTTDATLNENIKFFGQDVSRRSAVIGTVNHLHEHLGQLIAYARVNNLTPPWSR
jgi:uncharacterized damage-inducible protein DinB